MCLKKLQQTSGKECNLPSPYPSPALQGSFSNKVNRAGEGNTKQGFTLIEILIVIVIISIVSGIAALTLSRNQQKQYEYLANNLAHIITLAEEEAMLRPATLGLAFTSHSFQFFEYHNKADKNAIHWQPLTDSIFGLHHISKNIEIILFVQNKKIDLNGKPQVIISTSGDIAPFTIWLGRKDQPPSYEVIGYPNGNVISRIFHEK